MIPLDDYNFTIALCLDRRRKNSWIPYGNFPILFPQSAATRYSMRLARLL